VFILGCTTPVVYFTEAVDHFVGWELSSQPAAGEGYPSVYMLFIQFVH
jgi:hypothetical protein